MKLGKTPPRDEEIWKMACNDVFMPSPRRWHFEDQGVMFGSELFRVDRATLYELAFLDIHSQYWETSSPEYLRRYHRALQYHVEFSFRSAVATSTYHTPPFLKGWLVRVIFMKEHNRNGREMVEYILKDISNDQRISKDQKLKLEAGNFQEDDWKAVISNGNQRAELSKMINTICSERQISRNSKTGYPWSLPHFDAIKTENHGILTDSGNNSAALLYKYEVVEPKWEGILKLSTSRVWTIANISLGIINFERLLLRKWIDNDIIDAYLVLCGYLRPDMRFLSTEWFNCFHKWGTKASMMTVNWISKHEANVEAAVKKFTAVITVINYPQNHWVTLQFDPNRELLEVFDSMAPRRSEHRLEKFEKMLQTMGLKNWSVQARKNVPQQEGYIDCGIYACQFVKHLALEIPFPKPFSNEQCEWFRKTMVVELADGRVRIPWR